MQKCKNCNEIKELSEYNKNKRRKFGIEIVCKACLKNRYKDRIHDYKKQKIIYDKEYRKNNKKKISKYKKEYAEINNEKIKLYQKEYLLKNKKIKKEYDSIYYINNKKHKAKYIKSWYINNPGKKLAYDRKRELAKKNRTPKWLTDDDFWIMEQFYIHAKEQEKLIGIKFHVDHIIPLQNTKVSGLHCPLNLQVIPAFENLQKGNSFTN